MKTSDPRPGATAGSGGYRTVPTRVGVRLVQHGTVLSEVRSSPGPTHSVADVIAAAVHTLNSGARVAMLGFAGGGILAPLTALGRDHEVSAVDLDESGWRLFQDLCAGWSCPVRFRREEACAWIRQCPDRFDVIIEDLSISSKSDVFKPEVTWSALPPLVYDRLNDGGAAVFNLLPPSDGSWASGIERVWRPGYAARLVCFQDFENRLLVVGKRLPGAHKLSRRMRAALRVIGSHQASRIRIRTCRPDAGGLSVSGPTS